MPRLPRLDAPGSRHHVMNRGARREPIFIDDQDCGTFIDLLSELPDRFDTHVHAYALMPNHFHVLLTAGRHGLGAPMRFLQGEFSRSLNRRHAWDGPVWRSRFKNRPVDSEDYWRHLLAYVHLNPVRANLVPTVDAARWTSHSAYSGRTEPPDWMDRSEHLELFGDVEGYRIYLRDLVVGRDVAPEGFDPDRLFRRTERVAPVATERAPTRSRDETWPMSDEAAWAALTLVTNADRDGILERSRGRSGNPRFWLAAWWLPRATGQTHAKWARKLDVSRSAIARSRPRLAARVEVDAQVARWKERLEALLPSDR